ncbi:MAG: APC family permease [Chloroflexi bacterium]|nr:APC family permease [Chloroflexota bacterium]
MHDTWQPKPGDRTYRPRRVQKFRLKKVLGISAIFSAGYANVGSSIYYALGVVALFALGATPIALGLAGIIYVFNALTYAEGSAMIPEGGGSASFARHGFNDLGGFIAGWALMLSYIATIAISAYTIPPYLSHFWPVLREPAVDTLASMGIIVFLMFINVLGVVESSLINIVFIAIDILTQVTLVVLGIVLILLPDPQILVQNMFGEGNWPSTSNLIFGIAIAALCFTGVETVSQLAEETRQAAKRVPRAYILNIIAVLVMFAGISIVALSAMTPQALGDPINGWARDPVAGIAANLPSPLLQSIFAPLVAVLAASILLTATNAGVLGISRLTFNLATHHQLPVALSRVHRRFRTPYIAIIVFSFIALLVLAPGLFAAPTFFADVGALYVFGSLLGFALAHAAVISLRIRKPQMPRPFKVAGNIKIMGRPVPVTAILGLLGTLGVWVVVLVTNPYSRWAGFAWMFIGLAIYYLYRRRARIPLTHYPNKHQEVIREG